MTDDFPYATAAAFGTALGDRFRSAAQSSRHSINELRRQFAYDRFLVRLFSEEESPWVLKGAGGLLARLPTEARHSMDLDLFFQGQIDHALDMLESAARFDLGDFFDFDISEVRGLGLTNARRLRIVSYIGNKTFEQFRIDLVIASNMTQKPDRVQPLRPVDVPGLPSVDYVVYPLVDHIADKHAAMLATYNDGSPSTRYRDLVDLMLIANSKAVGAIPLRQALLSEYEARGLAVPPTIELPSEAWIAGYAAQVESISSVTERTATEALESLRSFLLPVLAGKATGQWNPQARCWE